MQTSEESKFSFRQVEAEHFAELVRFFWIPVKFSLKQTSSFCIIWSWEHWTWNGADKWRITDSEWAVFYRKRREPEPSSSCWWAEVSPQPCSAPSPHSLPVGAPEQALWEMLFSHISDELGRSTLARGLESHRRPWQRWEGLPGIHCCCKQGTRHWGWNCFKNLTFPLECFPVRRQEQCKTLASQ